MKTYRVQFHAYVLTALGMDVEAETADEAMSQALVTLPKHHGDWQPQYLEVDSICGITYDPENEEDEVEILPFYDLAPLDHVLFGNTDEEGETNV